MKYFIFVSVICLGFLSCKKDSSSSGPSKTELITQSSWKYDDAGADLDKNGTVDFSFTSQIPACVIDNTLTLQTGGTGTVDEGATKCDPSTPQTAAITWGFTNNETSLNLGGGGLLGISGQFKIVTLDQNNLSLSRDTTYQGAQVAFVLKLKH
jgi:hypothetical protein